MKKKIDMADLSHSMMPGKPVSQKMRSLLDAEKNEARKRIIERGIVHFRADPEFMTALFALAARSKVAPGTLCRRIVWDYLQAAKKTSGVAEPGSGYTPSTDVVIAKLNDIQDLIVAALSTNQSTKGHQRTKNKR
jgi:hypothetical protein